MPSAATPPFGDNQVEFLDVSFLGGHYGVTEGNALYENILDVGPTTDNSTNGRPTTDNRIQFEDLMMFAINYGAVSKPAALLPAAASNALALASVSQRGFFANGTQSIIDLGADIIATVGSTANRASNEILIQQSLREQSEIDLENVSGVNLDEEAANMLRYQDAYMAASKVVSIADNLFQNLLQIVGHRRTNGRLHRTDLKRRVFG